MAKYEVLVYRIGLIGITNFLLSLSGIILLPLATKNMSIDEYGIWAQIGVTIGLLPGILLLGLPYTMVRFLPSINNKKDIQELFYTIFIQVLVITLIVSILIFYLSKPIASSLFGGNINVVKTLALIVFFECLNNILYNYFRATQQIKKHSMLSIIQTCLTILFVSIFLLLGKGIFGATIGLLITTLILFLVMIYIVVSEVGFKFPKFTHIREYLNFGLPTVPGYTSSWIVNSSDRYIIGLLLGTSFVGYYSPGYVLGNIIRMFVTPLFFMLPMVSSKAYDKGNLNEVQLILQYSLKYYLAIAIPSTLGMSFLSKPLLELLSTPDIAINSYLITPFVALSTLLFGVFTIVQQIIILEKKTKITAKIWTASALLNIVLNLLFIPYMGILGAAISTLIAFAFSLILVVYYSFRIFTFDISFKFIAKSIFASCIICIYIVLINPKELFDIILTISFSAIVYFIILLLLRSFESKEINFMKKILSFRKGLEQGR